MRANPELATLTAQINRASGLPLNREQRRAEKRQSKCTRPTQRRKVFNAHERAVNLSKPYEPGDMVDEHLITRAAYDRLINGNGSDEDFSRVAMMINIGLVLAEGIHESLVATIQDAQHSMVRCQERVNRGLNLGLDAKGLQTVPAGLDTYEAMVDSSSPMQLRDAIKEAWRRMWGGDILQILEQS